MAPTKGKKKVKKVKMVAVPYSGIPPAVPSSQALPVASSALPITHRQLPAASLPSPQFSVASLSPLPVASLPLPYLPAALLPPLRLPPLHVASLPPLPVAPLPVPPLQGTHMTALMQVGGSSMPLGGGTSLPQSGMPVYTFGAPSPGIGHHASNNAQPASSFTVPIPIFGGAAGELGRQLYRAHVQSQLQAQFESQSNISLSQQPLPHHSSSQGPVVHVPIVEYYGGGETNHTSDASSQSFHSEASTSRVQDDIMDETDSDDEEDDDGDEEQDGVDFGELDNLPGERWVGRGGGIGLQAPANSADRKWLTLTPDGEFDQDKVTSAIALNLKRIMQHPHTSYPNFTDDEKQEARDRFEKTFQWDEELSDMIWNAYEKVCQLRFSGAMNKAKTWWREVCKKPEYAKKHKTWIPKEWLPDYVTYWTSPKCMERSRRARNNRNRRRGPNYLGGSRNQQAHRKDLAKVKGKDLLGNDFPPEKVPQHELWLKTRSKELKNGVRKWANPWCKEALDKYMTYCANKVDPDISKWKPWELSHWITAVGKPKKGKLPGLGSYGDPELLGVKFRKIKKYIYRGESSGMSEAKDKEYNEQIAVLTAKFEASIVAQQAKDRERDALIEMLRSQIDLRMSSNNQSPPNSTFQQHFTQHTFVPTQHVQHSNASQPSQMHDDVYRVPPPNLSHGDQVGISPPDGVQAPPSAPPNGVQDMNLGEFDYQQQ